jgi:hypothetical protein
MAAQPKSIPSQPSELARGRLVLEKKLAVNMFVPMSFAQALDKKAEVFCL